MPVTERRAAPGLAGDRVVGERASGVEDREHFRQIEELAPRARNSYSYLGGYTTGYHVARTSIEGLHE